MAIFEEEKMGDVKPILFNTAMTRAILNGTKTMTRRVIKPQPVLCDDGFWHFGNAGWSDTIHLVYPMPGHSMYNKMPYAPGDILWVREAWNYGYVETPDQPGYERWFEEVRQKDTDEYIKAISGYYYKADDDGSLEVEVGMKWRPSIHMPREAARIFLRVKEVWAERLKDIFKDPTGPNNQIVQEGFSYGCDFIAGWNKTVPSKNISTLGYDANPWVWVIEFERCEKPKEMLTDGAHDSEVS
jgi:hypothetical protein